MSAHAWNEFWLDGVGWVPVDASLGWAMRHRPWNWLGQGLPLRPEAYFARLDGARIGFSYGPDVGPAPAFAPVSVEGGTELRVAGRDLTWGVETLDGGLPYLQPAYPRFTSSPVRRQDLLGRWRVAELGRGWRLVRVRNVAFGVFALAGAASVVVDFVASWWSRPSWCSWRRRPVWRCCGAGELRLGREARVSARSVCRGAVCARYACMDNPSGRGGGLWVV